jgi:hypothetical protein
MAQNKPRYTKQEKQEKDGYTHDFKGLQNDKNNKNGQKARAFYN